MLLSMIFLIVALVLFVVAALGIATGRYSLVAAGLAFWVASEIVKLAR